MIFAICWFTAAWSSWSWRHKLCGKSRLSWSISAIFWCWLNGRKSGNFCFGYWPSPYSPRKRGTYSTQLMKKKLYYWIFQTIWLEGFIVPMKVTLERLGLEQPKVSECWNKGERGNFAVSFMRPLRVIFQGLSGAMFSFFKVWFPEESLFATSGPIHPWELHFFPCFLPLQLSIMFALVLARFSSQIELPLVRLGHTERMIPLLHGDQKMIEAEDRIIGVNQVCYEPAKMLQEQLESRDFFPALWGDHLCHGMQACVMRACA